MTIQKNIIGIDIMDQTGNWLDKTGDWMGTNVTTPIGLSKARDIIATTGQWEILMKNVAQTYNPVSAGLGGLAAIRARTRMRVTPINMQGTNIAQISTNGPGGLGGTVTLGSSPGGGLPVGNAAGVNTHYAQPFTGLGGTMTQFTFTLGANSGTPSSGLTWEIQSDNGIKGNPSTTVLATGTVASPTPSATNTVSALSIPLSSNQVYWLVLYPTAIQAYNVYYIWNNQFPAVYTLPNVAYSTDGGLTWIVLVNTTLECSFTASNVAAFFNQASATVTANNDVIAASLNLRAQFDSIYNLVRVTLFTENNTFTSDLVLTNKWQTYTISGTCTGAGTHITLQFQFNCSATGLNSEVVEYRNITMTKNAGANLLVNGNFASGTFSSWVITNAGGQTITATVMQDYLIRLNGFIVFNEPAAHITAGDLTVKLTCQDMIMVLAQQTIDAALQSNQTADQLMTVLANALPIGDVHTTIPGKLFDVGTQSFQRAFDGYTKQKTSLLQAAQEIAANEFGRVWIDLDGTLRLSSRTRIPKQIVTAPKIAFTDGQSTQLSLRSDQGTLLNEMAITAHPRDLTGTPGTVLGKINGAVQCPPGKTTSITITYVDSVGNTIGGDAVTTPPVANTDFTFNERADGTGVDYTTFYGVNTFFPSIVVSASQITYNIFNQATGPLYVTKLQVRGTPVYKYNPVTIVVQDTGSIQRYQKRGYPPDQPKDLSFVNDINYTKILAQYYIAQYRYPFTEAHDVQMRYKAQITSVDLFSLELFDMVSVTDAQSGMSAVKHMIIGWSIDSGQYKELDNNIKLFTLVLERLDQTTYGIFDDAVYGKFDTTLVFFI